MNSRPHVGESTRTCLRLEAIYAESPNEGVLPAPEHSGNPRSSECVKSPDLPQFNPVRGPLFVVDDNQKSSRSDEDVKILN